MNNMIIDCFTFDASSPSELDILEARLRYLWNHVHMFVLRESNLHLAGHEKQFVFQQNLDRFKFYTKKIIYHPYYYCNSKVSVDRHIEEMQTSHVMSGLSQFPDDSIILLGDVSAIPNLDIVSFVKQNNMLDAQCIQEHYISNLNNKHIDLISGTCIVHHGHLKQQSMEWFNRSNYTFPKIYNGGWKFSDFLSPIQTPDPTILNHFHPEFSAALKPFIK